MNSPKMKICARSSQERRLVRSWFSIALLATGSAKGEVGEDEEHAEDAGVYQVEPSEGNGAAAAGGGGVHGWLVLDGYLSSMARIFFAMACSGNVTVQLAVVDEQVADSQKSVSPAGTFAAHGVLGRVCAGRS